MRALLDEDVHVKVLDWLITEGHDVIRVPEEYEPLEEMDFTDFLSSHATEGSRAFLSLWNPKELKSLILLSDSADWSTLGELSHPEPQP